MEWIKAVNEIQRIIDEIEQGPENIRKIIVLQAPTGTGKSWISAALALKYGASILTKTAPTIMIVKIKELPARILLLFISESLLSNVFITKRDPNIKPAPPIS